MATFFPPSRPNRRAQSPRAGAYPPPHRPSLPYSGLDRLRTARRRLPMPVPNPVQPTRKRLGLVWFVLILAAFGLACNLFRLQVVQGSMLRERALAQQTTSLNRSVPRRSIVDRTGNTLAMDRPVFSLYAHPAQFKQPKETVAYGLSPILGVQTLDLIRKFNEADTGIKLDDTLSEEKADQIRALSIDGLDLTEAQQRIYPQKELFANIIGYVDVDQQGQAGIEASYQDLLTRKAIALDLSRSGDGSLLPGAIPDGYLKQDDLHLQLTLDMRLQRSARYQLRQKLQQYKAKRGAVLVMDVRDGSLLALVSEPSYDPNRYYEADVNLFRNWAVSDLYEPGSTFKPINVAIALEENAVSISDVFEDQGMIQVGGWPINNFDYKDVGGHGPLSVPQIVMRSSNVGMVHMMERLDPKVYYEWLQKLISQAPTGVDLPNDVAGQLKDREQFITAPIEAATTAFGQGGFSLTPLHLLQLQASLANGGTLVTPHVVRGLYTSQNELSWRPNLAPSRRVFSAKTAADVLSIMEQVVTDGTGQVAKIPGYRIAGKTGTAQKAGAGGYAENGRITSFVGIFPVEMPRYVVLAVIDEPQGDDAYGSTVAAPIVKSIIEALITIDQIPPSQAPEPTPAASASSAAPTESQEVAPSDEPIEPEALEGEYDPSFETYDGNEDVSVDGESYGEEIPSDEWVEGEPSLEPLSDAVNESQEPAEF